MPYIIDRSERGGIWEATQVPGLMRALAHAARRILRRGRSLPGRPSTAEASRLSAPRLMQRADGSPACTACMLCVKACTAACIRIERKASVWPEERPGPALFTIDMLKCTFCGACVEACPCDALRMDAGALPQPAADRASFVYDLGRLLSNHPGGASPLSRAL